MCRPAAPMGGCASQRSVGLNRPRLGRSQTSLATCPGLTSIQISQGVVVDAADMGADLERVLVTEEQIRLRIAELAVDIWGDYEGKDLLLVGVLKGAVMVMSDLMGG